MKFATARNKTIVFVAVIFFILTLNFVSQEVRGLFGNFSSGTQRVFWNAGGTASDFFSGMFQGTELKQKNESLISENFTLMQKIVSLRDIENENTELRLALGLGVQKEFVFVEAVPIGKNILEDVLIIKIPKGSEILEGMPVITPSKIIVGRILQVRGETATVQLLSEKESSIDAKVAGKNVTGVIRGKGAAQLLFDLVEREQEISKGDLLVTSNLGGIFPENIFIGEIKNVLQEGAEHFQKAEVTPFFDITQAELLFVLTEYDL